MLTIETRRAARYCDEVCQRADYALQHKLECTTFARLPTTMAFQSEADTEEQFPQHPVFAHAHKDGVGLWVTVEGRIDCEYVETLVIWHRLAF